MNSNCVRAFSALGTAVLRDRAAAAHKNGSQRRGATYPLIIGLLFLASSAPAIAQTTWVGAGTPPFGIAAAPAVVLAKNPGVNSYVETSDGFRLFDGVNFLTNPNIYPAILSQFGGADTTATIDVLMQQCYGGGFAAGTDAAINPTTKGYSFMAATNWNELAYNRTSGGGTAATITGVNNFTRAWFDAFPRPVGVAQHYADATKGRAAAPVVAQDIYAPGGLAYKVPALPSPPGYPGSNRVFEDPSFASPDPLLGGTLDLTPRPAGPPNNTRDVMAAQGATWWAVLAESQPDSPRFDVNLDRVYESLTRFNVPANHIIILGPGANTAAIPNIINPATGVGLASHPINAPFELNKFKDAVAGTGMFANPARAPGAHLFVYQTGHGNSFTKNGLGRRATPPTNPGGGDGAVMVDVHDMPANGFTGADGSDASDGIVDLQILTATPLDAGAVVALDGVSMASPVSQSLTPLSPGSYPSPAVYLNDVIGNSYPYDFSVPLSFINSLDAGSPLEIELHNLTSASAYDGLVSAVTFNDYGDNWSLLAVPEPATWVLLVSGLAIAIILRRRNYRLLIVSRRSDWHGQIVGDLR